MNRISRIGVAGALLLSVFLGGCSTKFYRHSADHAAYGVIQSKTPLVPNADTNFTIEQTGRVVLERFPINTNVETFLGPYGERERGARVLNLIEALDVAVHVSRDYQSQKEDLYRSALALTLARHDFAPIFSANGNLNYGGETQQAVSYRFNPNTGNLEPVFLDKLVEQQRFAGNGRIGASWLIRDVGKLTTDITADFLHFVTGAPHYNSGSALAASFTRPLVRNAGFKSESEALTTAEREVLYALRRFTRYRKDFTVQISRAYYNVLGSRDAARNLFLNLQSSRKNAERSRALAEEGRITQSDLGRLEQQVLTAESSWINSVRTYQQSLDSFKLQLGLIVDANLVLDDKELAQLEILDPKLSVDESIQIALGARLDYLTVKDQVADAERQLAVRASFLKPQLDFGSSVAVYSNPNRYGGLQLPDPQRYSWNAGLTLDPGLDRVAERNAYRQSLIDKERAVRAVAQQEDEIKLQVRDSWRTLEQAKRNYEISQIGVKLAERRVEEQNLLAELGRAKALDQVDAQNALSDSKNQLTQAIVTHTIARLQFWDNLGILYIKDNGQWEETQDAKAK